MPHSLDSDGSTTKLRWNIHHPLIPDLPASQNVQHVLRDPSPQ